MDQPVLLALIALGSSALTAAVTQLLSKLPARGDATKSLVTNLLAENERLAKRNEALEDDNSDLRDQRTKGEHLGRVKDDYIHQLRRQIAEGTPPPPIEYPKGMKQ